MRNVFPSKLDTNHWELVLKSFSVYRTPCNWTFTLSLVSIPTCPHLSEAIMRSNYEILQEILLEPSQPYALYGTQVKSLRASKTWVWIRVSLTSACWALGKLPSCENIICKRSCSLAGKNLNSQRKKSFFHIHLSVTSSPSSIWVGEIQPWQVWNSPISLVTQLCPTLATPWTVDCQAPLSVGFSRQEYWSGLPFRVPADFRGMYKGLGCWGASSHLSMQVSTETVSISLILSH